MTRQTATLATWDDWNSYGGPEYPRDEVVRLCMRRFNDPAKRASVRALDLGCGGGVNTIFLASKGFAVTACDISEKGVARTCARLAERNLNASVSVGSLETFEYPAGSFDLVLCIGVLDCVPASIAASALPRIAKLLRPGGVSLFVFASERDYRILDESTPYIQTGYTEAETRKMFSAAFASVEINRHIATEQNQAIALDEWMVTAANE